MSKKWCGRCKRNRPKSDFAKNRAKKDGLQERCTPCRKEHHSTPERQRAVRDKHFQYNYGITLEERDKMAKAQKNKCKICNKKRPLVVDHCHATGRIRGLLCQNCNRGIGLLGDSLENITAARDYLCQTTK